VGSERVSNAARRRRTVAASLPATPKLTRIEKQKSRRGIAASGGFWLIVLSYTYASPRESSVGWSIAAVATSPLSF
jgi:hypothetical protein